MAEVYRRRAFSKELLRGASRATGELGAVARAVADPAERVLAAGSMGFDPDHVRSSATPARPTERLASSGDLRKLCDEVGLAPWTNEAAALARISIRLTPGGAGGSRLGGVPDLPPNFEWPVWTGGELALLAQLQLDELPPSQLPRSGRLLLFFALAAAPSGLRPSDGDACRVLLVGDGPVVPCSRGEKLPSLPLAASAELTLPPEPASLPLDADELEAWTELRERLAAAQGVELEERAGCYHAIHRLLGYPDAIAASMELDAELVSQGIDLEADEQDVDELEARAAHWRLLLQVSSDDDLGVSLGYYERLYVWVRDDDLSAARFQHARAFVR
jgi:uncharacterized protein YwqG